LKKAFSIFLFFPLIFPAQVNDHSDKLMLKLDSLKVSLNKYKDDTNKVRACLALSGEWSSVNIDSATTYCNKAFDLSQKIGSQKGKALSHHQLGNLYLGKAKFEDALKEYKLSIGILRTLKNKTGIAIAYGGVANAYTMRGDLDSAVKYRILAIKILEAIGAKKNIATAYGNLGELYLMLNNYDKAFEYFNYHYKIMEGLGNKTGMIIPLNNIGFTLIKQGKDKDALSYLLKAKALCDETGNHWGLCLVLNNLGSIYQTRKELFKAAELFEKALIAAEKIGEVNDLSVSLFALGSINLDLKNYDRALYYFKRSYELVLLKGTNEKVQNALWGLAAVYEKKGNSAEALKYYKLYLAAKDSLLNKDISKQVTEMSTKYESEKKETQIKLLNKEKDLQKAEVARKEAEFSNFRNTAIIGSVLFFLILGSILFHIRGKRINEKIKIEKQLVEFEHQALRLQMNPHFIFNSLSSINNFIGKNETAEAKKFLTKFSKLMRSILENSREEYITLQKEIDSLKYYLELEQLRFNNKFTFEINTCDSIDPANTMIPPMLIQPQIENAILHGIGPKDINGKISVTFNKKNGVILCEVTDDGVGRKKTGELKNDFSLPHVSLAMTVTQERLQVFNAGGKTNGSISIEDLTDKNGNALGTKVIFILPVKQNI